ncbi:MAG: tRNA lysidine(34) synthetase TilS [Treponema sp.]|jgi:tRNA(Ile)-lysidine synthase|nr:tRNA lysidine(34) synthetase TilS [Treponema sp.]
MIPFEATVASKLGSWPAGTVFLAAVSGGADSTAMLSALTVIRDVQGYKVYCLHVDHGIRPPEETRGDALGVRNLCASLHVPCRIVSIPAGVIAKSAKVRGLGIEGAARMFRHRVWNRTARRIGAARILVAHTKDDLLETALMRFLRGSGPAGLGAMPQERGRILRPLLTFNRSEVLGYLRDRGISFRTDSTNEDIRYLRNRIRHKLVPCLDVFFPYWRKTVFAMAETQRLTAEFLSAEAEKQVFWEEDPPKMNLYTSAEVFFVQPPLVREEAVFQAADRLAKAGKKKKASWFEPDLTGLHWKEPIVRNPRRESLRLFTGDSKISALDAGPIRIEKQGVHIVVSSRIGKGDKKPCYDEGFALLIKKSGAYILKGLKIVCQFPLTHKQAEVLPLGIPVKLGGKNQEQLGFFAYLPILFRRSYQEPYRIKGLDRMEYSGYTNRIIAEDQRGLVACILSDKRDTMILLCREEEHDSASVCLSFIIVSGGIDV